MKRTFFTITRGGGGIDYYGFTVAARFTFEDVQERLIVERVSARLDGAPLCLRSLTAAFPEALTAALLWAAMKLSVKRVSVLRGPYILLTEVEPTDEQLVHWFRSGGALPVVDTGAEVKDIVDLAAAINAATNQGESSGSS